MTHFCQFFLRKKTSFFFRSWYAFFVKGGGRDFLNSQTASLLYSAAGPGSPLCLSKAEASSVRGGGGYSARNAADGDPATAFVSGATRKGQVQIQGWQPLGKKKCPISSELTNAPNGVFTTKKNLKKCPIPQNGTFFIVLYFFTKEFSPWSQKNIFLQKRHPGSNIGYKIALRLPGQNSPSRFMGAGQYFFPFGEYQLIRGGFSF